MINSTVLRQQVLAIIRTNRDGHRKIFEEAFVAFRREIKKELNYRLDNLRLGKPVALYISLNEPTDHTKDYDTAIKMLEMDVRDTIELDQETFANFVLDDWQWKRDFINNATSYTKKNYN